MLKQAIEKLLLKENLTQEECESATREMLSGANSHQTAAFLMLMRAKGETVEELHGATLAMRSEMIRVHLRTPVLDIVGTGGDRMHTLNISTASAILAASCGVKVAKHGNRSVSSLAGSADVLESLRINIHQPPHQIAACIEEIGIGFMFAPNFHPALKHLKEVRQNLGVRTLFNILGPLLSPASAGHLMLGVFSEDLLKVVAELLVRLKQRRSFVFHGCGLDELSCMGPAQVIEVSEEGTRSFILDPLEFGLQRCSIEDLRGKNADYNAKKIIEAFEGARGAFADTLALNAGVACYLYGIVDSIQKGIDLAKLKLEERQALHLLNQWKSYA